jgi:thioredoxin
MFSMQTCTSQPETNKNSSNTQELTEQESSATTKKINIISETKEIIDKPVHITKADFLAKIMDYEKNPTKWVFQGELPCLIDFYADWCAPCRQTAPILDELAREYSGKIIIYKIDVQKERELASVFGIQSIPAFLYCPLSGNPTMSTGIAGSRDETKKMFIQQIESFLLNTNPAAGRL